jgi:hypothetical protein
MGKMKDRACTAKAQDLGLRQTRLSHAIPSSRNTGYDQSNEPSQF